MNRYRRSAGIVGVLYIIGTAAGVASMIVSGGLTNAPEHLGAVAANPSPAIATALLVLVMGLALAIIPAVLFPIVKRESEALAVGYVIFRGALEGITYIGVAVCWLLLVVVAGAAAGSSGAAAGVFAGLGAFVMGAQEPIAAVQTIVFSIGGLMLYYVLYKARLVPRWLSAWGLVGSVLYLAGGVIAVFAPDPVPLLLPLALQEMVMAAWLIARGFAPAALEPAPIPAAA